MNRKKADVEAVAKRIIVIDPDKCKPNSGAYTYLKRYAKSCRKDCIQVEKKRVVVSEDACAMCVNRCKQAPGEAISVVKLPTNLTTDTTHRYGPNLHDEALHSDEEGRNLAAVSMLPWLLLCGGM